MNSTLAIWIETDSAVVIERISSGGFNRRLASGGEFRHRGDVE
jgi:hypothetical protein